MTAISNAVLGAEIYLQQSSALLTLLAAYPGGCALWTIKIKYRFRQLFENVFRVEYDANTLFICYFGREGSSFADENISTTKIADLLHGILHVETHGAITLCSIIGAPSRSCMFIGADQNQCDAPMVYVDQPSTTRKPIFPYAVVYVDSTTI